MGHLADMHLRFFTMLVLLSSTSFGGLISYYSMDTGTSILRGGCVPRGDIPDPSLVNGGAIQGTACANSNCIDLGNNGGLNLGSFSFAGSGASLDEGFSMSFFTTEQHGSGNPGSQPMIVKTDSFEIEYARVSGNDGIRFTFFFGGSSQSLFIAYQSGALRHFVVTITSAGLMEVFSGGTSASSLNGGAPFSDLASNLLVGCSSACTEYEGTIDELSFFDHVLTQAEINTLGDNTGTYPLTAPAPPTVQKAAPCGGSCAADGTSSNGFDLFDLVLGESLVLEVAAPSGSYVWDAGQSANCEDVLVLAGQDTSTLSITTTELDVVGEVEVSICNTDNSASVADTIAINVLPSDPVILVQPPASINAFFGETVNIAIQVDGRPPPLVQWQKLVQVEVNCTDVNGTFVCPNSTARVSRNVARTIAPTHERYSSSSPYEARGPTGNATTILDVWQSIAGATNATLSFIASSGDEGLYRASVTNGVTASNFSDETLLSLQDNGGGGDGGGGDVGGDGGSASIGPAIGGAVSGVALLICCLFTCFVCCLFICFIILLAALLAGGGKAVSGGIALKPPDWDIVTYGPYLEPMFEDMRSHREMVETLERLFIESGTSVARVLMANSETSHLDALTRALAIVYDQNGMAVELLKDQVTYEVGQAGDEGTLFRANSPVAKLFSFWVKIIGLKFIWHLLVRSMIRLTNIAQADDIKVDDRDGESDSIALKTTDMFNSFGTMEIDSNKMMSKEDVDEADLAVNVLELKLTIQKLIKLLLSARRAFPDELAFVLEHVYQTVSDRDDFSNMARYRSVGSFFFLRYICPVMVAPHAWGLLQDVPSPSQQRTLILISKVLQNLANNTLPGSKEAYMEPMNSLITENVPRVESFYTDLLSSTSAFEPVAHSEQPVALNNAVIHIHRYLCSNWTSIATHIKNDPEAGDFYLSFEEVVSSYPAGDPV